MSEQQVARASLSVGAVSNPGPTREQQGRGSAPATNTVRNVAENYFCKHTLQHKGSHQMLHDNLSALGTLW